jgi:hypothetical protein
VEGLKHMTTEIEFEPTGTYTFTISKAPERSAQVKTIRRLMEMQPEIQKGLSDLARRRAKTDNDPRRRAGRIWVHRKRRTNLVRVDAGESFTLRLSPKILPDLKSVLSFLEAKPA